MHMIGTRNSVTRAIQTMAAQPVDFFLDNVQMNNNVLRVAHDFQRWTGPNKVVSVLSTVMFPKDVAYPVTPAAIWQRFQCTPGS